MSVGTTDLLAEIAALKALVRGLYAQSIAGQTMATDVVANRRQNATYVRITDLPGQLPPDITPQVHQMAVSLAHQLYREAEEQSR